MTFLSTRDIENDDTRLTSEEKARIRETLHRTMRETPVRSPYLLHFSDLPRWAYMVSVPFLALLIVSTTVYAARGSLPGDALYPVKVSTEKVQGVFATSDEEKVKWNEHLAEVRIKEAELLAASDRLSTSTAEAIETDFNSHAEVAKVYREKVSEKDAPRATALSAEFGAALRAHSDRLAELADDATTTPPEGKRNSKKLSERVRAHAEEIKKDIDTEREKD